MPRNATPRRATPRRATTPRHPRAPTHTAPPHRATSRRQYYFADAMLRDVSFAGAAEDFRFTFYYDPTEPTNSENMYMNVNPEVVLCKFPGYI